MCSRNSAAVARKGRERAILATNLLPFTETRWRFMWPVGRVRDCFGRTRERRVAAPHGCCCLASRAIVITGRAGRRTWCWEAVAVTNL